MLTITGGLIILLGLWCFFTDGRRLVPVLVFFAGFSGTAVVNFANYGMSPAAVFLPLLLLWGALSGNMLRRVLVTRDHLLLLLLLAAFAFCSVVSLLLNSADHGMYSLQITQTAYVLFGVCLTLVLSLDLAQADRLERAVTALRWSAAFIAAWGVLQGVCAYTGLAYPAFLFNNSTSHFADMFDQGATAGISRLASVATEPSFLASSLMIFGAFGATVLAFEPRLRTRPWIFAVGITLLVVFASTSTTGYFGVALLAVLLGLRRPGLMVAAGAAGLLLLAIVVLALPSFAAALYLFTFGKASTGSYTDRTATIWAAVHDIINHPWLGGGWGSNFSFSILTIVPANAGMLGFAAFAVAYGGTILASRGARKSWGGGGAWRIAAYAAGLENAMIVYFGESVVSGFRFMVADIWVLWALGIGAASCLAREHCLARLRRSQITGLRAVVQATGPVRVAAARPVPVQAGASGL